MANRREEFKHLIIDKKKELEDKIEQVKKDTDGRTNNELANLEDKLKKMKKFLKNKFGDNP